MSQPGPAARRFYYAFYEYAVSSVRGKIHGLARCHRNYSAPHHPNLRSLINHQPTSASTQRTLHNRASLRDPEAANSFQKWREAPVITSDDQPFGSLEAGQQVLRGRQGSKMILELGVPRKRLQELQELYGGTLDQLSLQCGVRVEIAGSAVQQELEETLVQTVLMSGTPKQIAQVIEAIEGDDSSPDSKTRIIGAMKLRYKARNLQQQTHFDETIKAQLRLSDLENGDCKVRLSEQEFILKGSLDGISAAAKDIPRVVNQLLSADHKTISWNPEWGFYHTNGDWQSYSRHPEVLRSDVNAKLVETTRAMLRKLTHPAVVVTAFGPLDRGAKQQSYPAGVTVSSFTSITLQPVPFVSFNLRADSRTWKIIKQAETFRVHVFEASPEAAYIVQQFTQPYEDMAAPFKEVLGEDTVQLSKPKGAPKLHVPPLMYCMSCRIAAKKCTIVGDHVIVVASVYDAYTTRGDSLEGRWALSYGDRSYRDLGTALAPLHPADTPAEHPESYAGRQPQPSTPTMSTPGSSRSFSTMTARPRIFRFDAKDPSQRTTESDLTDYVTHPDLLDCPASEFFGMPRGLHFVQHRRMRQLVEWKRAADHASRCLRLQEDLSYAERKELEDTARTNYDNLDRALALRSAHDLRMMLDRGGLDPRLSPWLEQAVERGQVVLIEHLQRLRTSLHIAAISEDEYAKEALKLTRELHELEEVSGRLRAAMEDEAE